MHKRSALSWINVTGSDAGKFIHSQFTGDLREIPEGEALFTGYCQIKGRLIATLLVACISKQNDDLAASEHFVLILPQNMVEQTKLELQKFIMRSKVKLQIVEQVIINSTEPLPLTVVNSFHYLGQYWGLAEESANQNDNTDVFTEFELQQNMLWITPATKGLFVPQMIGLDKTGGVSFNKGCYPGQEVVARLHYLGKAKRGLYRATLAMNTETTDTLIGAKVVNAEGREIAVLSAKATLNNITAVLLVLTHEQLTKTGWVMLAGEKVGKVNDIQLAI